MDELDGMDPRSEMQPMGFGAIGIPHLDQYFGVWAMHEERLRSMVEHVRKVDLHVHVEQQRAAALSREGGTGPGTYLVTNDGIAIIDVKGTMTKYGSSMSQMVYGTIGVRRAIRQASRNDEVRGIVLHVDSPGGAVMGTADLVDDVADAAEKKRLVAYIEDLGASAAYWVASQAHEIIANRSAIVGSIGVYAVVYDMSGMAQMDGVKVHVVKRGEMKGAGVLGTEVTDEQLAEWQREVDEFYEQFVNGVAKGRGISTEKARELADGRVHIGAKAKALGLVDAIGTFESALKSAGMTNVRRSGRVAAESIVETESAGEPAQREECEAMAETQTAAPEPKKPAAASFEDLTACLPGADEKFICSQLAKKATLDQAQTAWMEEQQRRIEAKEKELSEAKAAAESAQAKKPGVKGLSELGDTKAASDSTDAIAEWNAAVSAKLAIVKDKAKAVRAVVKENPELHKAFLLATNDNYRRSA